uniref:Uncharacterized protein n=1 Tax=Glossina brevipalpis TaxID=37001 RepID=A0A1A9WWG7_9MUSC
MAYRKQKANDIQSLSDLKRIAEEFDKTKHVDKNIVRKFLLGFRYLMLSLKLEKSDVFQCAISWCRLYAKIPFFIDPLNEKLLKIYEDTIPKVLAYIIEFLKYLVPDIEIYHYTLLEIMDKLLRYAPFSVLEQIANFKPGTIASLQSTIENARDFKTQSLALKLMATLLKYTDVEKQNQELTKISWCNTNFAEDCLNALMMEASRGQFEHMSRELLNQEQRIFIVHYDEDVQFSKNLIDLQTLDNCNIISLFLPEEEVSRLKCNQILFDYFNKPEREHNNHQNNENPFSHNLTEEHSSRHEDRCNNNFPNNFDLLTGQVNDNRDSIPLSALPAQEMEATFQHFEQPVIDVISAMGIFKTSISTDTKMPKTHPVQQLCIDKENSTLTRKSTARKQRTVGTNKTNVKLPTPTTTTINTPTLASGIQSVPFEGIDINVSNFNDINSNEFVNSTAINEFLLNESLNLSKKPKAAGLGSKIINNNLDNEINELIQIQNQSAKTSKKRKSKTLKLNEKNKKLNLMETTEKNKEITSNATNIPSNFNQTKNILPPENVYLFSTNDKNLLPEITFNNTTDQENNHDPLNLSNFNALRDSIVPANSANIPLLHEPQSFVSSDELALSVRNNNNNDENDTMETIYLSNYENNFIDFAANLRSPLRDNSNRDNNSVQVVDAFSNNGLAKKDSCVVLNNRRRKIRNQHKPLRHHRPIPTDLDSVVGKMNQISQYLLAEAGTQHVELEEIKDRVQFLVRNLEDEVKTYTKRFEQFKRFEARTNQLLNDLYETDSSTSAW